MFGSQTRTFCHKKMEKVVAKVESDRLYATFAHIPTFPPFANIASACALPIPLAAPVMIATLPSIFISAPGVCAAASLLLLLLKILMLCAVTCTAGSATTN